MLHNHLLDYLRALIYMNTNNLNKDQKQTESSNKLDCNILNDITHNILNDITHIETIIPRLTSEGLQMICSNKLNIMLSLDIWRTSPLKIP